MKSKSCKKLSFNRKIVSNLLFMPTSTRYFKVLLFKLEQTLFLEKIEKRTNFEMTENSKITLRDFRM